MFADDELKEFKYVLSRINQDWPKGDCISYSERRGRAYALNAILREYFKGRTVGHNQIVGFALGTRLYNHDGSSRGEVEEDIGLLCFQGIIKVDSIEQYRF